MKRRFGWALRLRAPFAARRQAPARTAARASGPRLMPVRIVLRFRDGSSVLLDPESPPAVEIHRIADRWLTGG